MAIVIDNTLIRDKREELRLFPKDMASTLNIDLSFYRQIENGLVTPDDILLKNICSILNLNIKDVKKEVKRTKILSIFNAKGGVGKSSTTLNLASIMAEKGYKVLCVDLDYQCSLTKIIGISPDNHKTENIFKIFGSEKPFQENAKNYIINTGYDNFDIICGSPNMKYLDKKIQVPNRQEYILYESFKDLIKESIYDFILFDNSPANHIAISNSFFTCNYVIVPLIVGERLSLDALDGLFDSVNDCLLGNSTLKGMKMFVNKYDRRVNKIDESLNEVIEKYSDYLFDSMIRVDAQIVNGQNERLPINIYNPRSKSVEDYNNLLGEIVALD